MADDVLSGTGRNTTRHKKQTPRIPRHMYPSITVFIIEIYSCCIISVTVSMNGQHQAATSSAQRLLSSSQSSSSKATATATIKWCGRSCLLHGLLIVSLTVLLAHTLRLVHQSHSLVEQQQDAFAVLHKQQFFQRSGGNHRAASSNKATDTTAPSVSYLANLRILVAIASYDFAQLPHLEEVLDGYHDVCVAGAAHVDVVVHTTVVYPVAYVDLWNTRFPCPHFSIQLVVKNANLRLHLADCHRTLFYQHLKEYDLFIYTEDDIRTSPTTVATYWHETLALQARKDLPKDYTLYNIGIVRYEYNFPSVIINDKTRHATENVTRVYWEHGSLALAQKKPILPEAAKGIDSLNQNNNAQEQYIHMTNHHQGMFLATQAHLQMWQHLDHCQFDIPKERPGTGPQNRQPLLGTQRVWMSSYQLYEKKYCNIQQVLPISKFGALTVHHVPNKNYRRKQRGTGKTVLPNLTTAMSSTTAFDQASPDLITALQLHWIMRQAWPLPTTTKYQGTITMVDDVTQDRSPTMEERFQAYRAYVARGGILSDQDMIRTNLIEWEERYAKAMGQAERKRQQEEQYRLIQGQEDDE
jgi:hypothetical protein